MMTIEQVRDLALQFAAHITAEARAFEAATGCVIHSIPVRPAADGKPVTVEVKVQIP